MSGVLTVTGQDNLTANSKVSEVAARIRENIALLKADYALAA